MPQKPRKTLYHSKLCQLGAVLIDLVKGPQPSKHANKPEYVTMTIDDGEGEGVRERYYNCENKNCADFFRGFKEGEQLVIIATGSREDATIELDNDSTMNVQRDQQQGHQTRQQPTQRQPTQTQRGMGGQGSPAPAKEAQPPKGAATERPAKQNAPAAKPAPGNHAPVYGATVGMAVKEAVGIVREIGIQPLTPDFYRIVNEIASDIIRIALSLESGHLVPKLSDRIAASAAAQQPKE